MCICVYVYMCICVYVYCYVRVCNYTGRPATRPQEAGPAPASAATWNGLSRYSQSPYLHYGFRRVLPKHNLNSKGWNSHVHGGFPGKLESSNLSRDNVSREIGRTTMMASQLGAMHAKRDNQDDATHVVRPQMPHLQGRAGANATGGVCKVDYTRSRTELPKCSKLGRKSVITSNTTTKDWLAQMSSHGGVSNEMVRVPLPLLAPWDNGEAAVLRWFDRESIEFSI